MAQTTLPDLVDPNQNAGELANPKFFILANVPPEVEWLGSKLSDKTKKAYIEDIQDFMNFFGVQDVTMLRMVTRSHVSDWRNDLLNRQIPLKKRLVEGARQVYRNLAASTIRRKMSALSSLFKYLCDQNAVNENPVSGVERPSEGSNEGKSPALSDQEASALLDSPDTNTIKGKRDRAILAVLLYHALRREELCKLKVGDLQKREGVIHFAVHGKGSRLDYLPLTPFVLQRIDDYLAAAGHGEDRDCALFQPVKNSTKKMEADPNKLNKPLHPESVRFLVRDYCRKANIEMRPLLSPHAMRATAATNAFDNNAGAANLQDLLRHKAITSTMLYRRRKGKIEDNAAFKIHYNPDQ